MAEMQFPVQDRFACLRGTRQADPVGANLKKRYLIVAMAVALFAAIMFVFSPRPQWPTMAMLTAVSIAMFAGLMTPTVRRAAQARKRLFVLAGVGTLIISVGVLVAALAYPSAFNVEVSADAFCTLMLVGSFLIWLPYMAATTDRVVEAQKLVRSAGRVGAGAVNAITEATDALSDPLLERTSFAEVVGPWFLAFCVLPPLVGLIDSAAKSRPISQGQAMLLLLALLGLILVGYLILIIAGIQWTRFVVTYKKPNWFSIPGGAVWACVWRLFIFGSVFRATQGIEPWLARQLPGVAPVVLQAMSEAAVFALALLGAPFALSLTAAALGASSRVAEMRMRVIRTTGRRVYLGAAVVIAPFFVISWLYEAFSAQLKGSIVQMFAAYIYFTAMFLTVTALAGYFGRLYVKSDLVG